MADEPNKPVVPAEPDDDDSPPTSADTVKDKNAKVIRKLETRINVLEDGLAQANNRNKELEGKLEIFAKTPSKVLPGKSLLDEVSEFLFPTKQTPPATPNEK